MKKNYFGAIYSDLMSKYRKFSFRLQKGLTTGNFWKLPIKKRQSLLARIEKLRLRLESINPKLAGTMLATGFILTANTVMSQANFVQQTGTSNPADAVVLSHSGYNAPVLADLDNDGDKDMIVADGSYYGSEIQYWKNTGSAASAVFTQQTGTNDPFSTTSGFTLNSQSYTVPTFGDIDGDGDLDLLIGHDGDLLQFYRNTGTNTSPVFTFETGTTFPSINTIVGGYVYDELSPSFVDIDGDGDLDVMIGNEDEQNFVMLQNTGTATAPAFTFLDATNTSNPFAAVNPVHSSYTRVEPGFGDIDKDGDIDAWIGGATVAKYFQNVGTTTLPNFVEVTGTNNPFAAFVSNGYSYANFVDIDADGDNDYFVGSGTGIEFWLNTDPSITTGINNNDISNEVSIFPTPTQNSINVSINDEKQLSPEVLILDVRGVEVMKYKATSNNFAIDISTLADGIYTMKIATSNKVAIKKIVKN